MPDDDKSGASASNEVRDEPEVQLFAAERLAFFTDAVVAIAITLLALDLERPEGDSWSAVLHSIGNQADGYIAFLISFFIIANAWVSHHALFRYVTRSDTRLLWINLIWLLLVVVAPFFTRVIVDGNVYYQFRFACYAAVQVLLGVLIIRMASHAAKAHLLVESTPTRFLRRLKIRSLVVAVPFALSIPAVFVPAIGENAFVLWWLGPPVMGVILTVRRKLAERRAAAHGSPA